MELLILTSLVLVTLCSWHSCPVSARLPCWHPACPSSQSLLCACLPPQMPHAGLCQKPALLQLRPCQTTAFSEDMLLCSGSDVWPRLSGRAGGPYPESQIPPSAQTHVPGGSLNAVLEEPVIPGILWWFMGERFLSWSIALCCRLPPRNRSQRL